MTHDDDNYIASEHSSRTPTWSMSAASDGSRPRFENISAKVMPRSDENVIVRDSIIGCYRIRQQIGVGAMGSVFDAVHMVLPRRAAIKVMHAQLRSVSGIASRMVQEAAILDQLHHPGVSRVFDCGILADGRPWIAMELIAGESLAAKMTRDTTLSALEVCNLISAVADVLAKVHALGIVHRDLKPDNILFAEASSGFPLRVIDWGVAHASPEARLTVVGETCGTPVYMSPEQAAGRDIAPPCDIYSLGVIAYEALAGIAPFEAQTLTEVVALHESGDAASLVDYCSAAPRVLCELIHRMIHKTAACRPSAADVREAMQRIAFELIDHKDDAHFAVAVTSAPSSDDSVGLDLHAIAKPRWTPQTSMVAGSGYLMLRPHGDPNAAKK